MSRRTGLPDLARCTNSSVRGQRGTGMVDTTTFAVPENSLERWMTRLTEHAVEFEGPFERFSHQVIAFGDPNGLALELAALERLARPTLPTLSGA